MCSIAECPYKFAVFWRARRGESKIKTKSETKSKNTQWYYTPKRPISYLASNCSIVCAFLIRSEKRSCQRSVAHAAEQLNRFFTTQNHQLFDISWYSYSIRALFLRYLVQLDTLFLTLILGETPSEKAGQARDKHRGGGGGVGWRYKGQQEPFSSPGPPPPLCVYHVPSTVTNRAMLDLMLLTQSTFSKCQLTLTER